MAMISSKWKIAILCALMMDGATRYNNLKRKTNGISNTLPVEPLREIKEGSPVKRTEYVVVPIRVEYGITEKTGALHPILKQLAQWTVSLS